MANVPLRRGMLIRHHEHVYEVTDFSERHSGKMKPTWHVSLRDVRDGRPVDRSLDELLPVVEVPHSFRRMQYLYARGQARVFMDAETFEELELGEAQLGSRGVFLVEGQEYRLAIIDGRPASLDVPDSVPIKVAFTAPPGHSVGGGSSVTKEATLENGLEIHVPLFVKTGDTIRVDTRTKTYAGKDHG
jgi:elongation factor P